MFTDNIWDDNSWSDPVYFDNPGFDQDVCFVPAFPHLRLIFEVVLG